MTRIEQTFKKLKADNKKAFVSYIMAGDPDFKTSLELVMGLPDAGVDIIELGLPFTDPMADGPTIQLAGGRSLDNGMTLLKTLDLAKKFREKNSNLIFHLKNHYCHIFAIREYYDQEKRKNIKEVLISKKGQSPKHWVSFKYVTNTLKKWSGYAIIAVDLLD